MATKHSTLIATLLLSIVALPRSARAMLWGDECEPPEVFYSASHDPAVTTPCCPRQPALCPGGVACNAGMCAAPYGSVTCNPAAPNDRPNIILLVNDDQGYCYYGFSGPACRSGVTGEAIPVPYTPQLDALGLQPANQGRGRIFEVGYAGGPYSVPARVTLHAGVNVKDQSNPHVVHRSVAAMLAQPNGPPYCSFGGGGKLVGSSGALGFSYAQQGRGLGKNPCQPAACAPNCDDPPLCGADNTTDPLPGTLQQVHEFIDTTLLGPRVNGQLDAATTYSMAQPFYMWYGAWIPHSPHAPPPAVEISGHPFGSTDFLFGQSAALPGTPRFPFGAEAYRLVFQRDKYTKGLYGMVWWADDGLHQLREHLEGIKVWDATGTQQVTLWDRTVVIVIADHGADLPRAKANFSENGYRTPIVIHDSGAPVSAVDTRVEQELVNAIDVMPTVLDYAGHPIPSDLPGYSLKPYVDGTPPAVPNRTTMCGHHVKGSGARGDRYIRVRPGAVGRCAPASGPSCAQDADCSGGGVCLLGACATGTLCLEDNDCTASETCTARQQKWCRFGRHPVTERAIPTPDEQPAVACTTDADCQAGCSSSNPINCTCEWREIKLYRYLNGETRLMDLFADPDEPGLSKGLRRQGPQPGDVPIGPSDPTHHLAERLQCCMDRWWSPTLSNSAVPGNPACTTCEPQYACHRCGDGIVDSDEQCDASNLSGLACSNFGFASGVLGCSVSCTVDTSGCS